MGNSQIKEDLNYANTSLIKGFWVLKEDLNCRKERAPDISLTTVMEIHVSGLSPSLFLF